MGRLAQTDGLTEIQRDILATVRDFVNKEIIPVANELEHRDEYPTQIVDGMKQLGLFGLTIPEEHGGLGEVSAHLRAGGGGNRPGLDVHVARHRQYPFHRRAHDRPAWHPGAEGAFPAPHGGREIRGAFSMSEPGMGSDVSAIRTRAVQADGGGYVINGQKMWLTNGASSNLVAVLCRTDEGHDTPHRNLTTFLIEKEPGFGATRRCRA